MRGDRLRREARLLAALTAAVTPIAFGAIAVIRPLTQPDLPLLQDPVALAGLAAVGVFAVAYVLSRSAHPRYGAALAVLVALAGTWGQIAVHDGTSDPPFPFLALVVLISSLLLPVSITAAVAVANVAAMAVLPFTTTRFDASAVATPLIFVAMLSALIVAAALVRHQDQRRIESQSARLREQHKLYEALVEGHEALGEGVCIVRGGRVAFVNDALVKLTGTPRDVLLKNGPPVAATGPLPDPHKAPNDDVESLFVTHFRRDDGTAVDVEVSFTSFAVPGGDLAVSVYRDVTERKRAEREIHARERRLAEAQRVAHVGSWEFDVATKRVTWSEELFRIHGHGAHVFRPTMERLYEPVHPEDAVRVRETLRRAIEAPSDAHIEYRILRPDAVERVLRASVKVETDDDGNARRLVGTAHDVTERVVAEEALRKNEGLTALGTLVAGVAHEINNPLAFMRANAEIMSMFLDDLEAESELPPHLKQRLEDVKATDAAVLEGVERIGKITQSLKQVAKPGAGNREPVDLNRIADSVLTVAAPRMRGGTHVDRDYQATQAAFACSNEVTQVVLNLVLNAADAVAGRERATVTVRTRDLPGMVEIQVEDSGAGIPTDQRDKIFTPFFTTKNKGTGLGLSISWRIVKDHGGDLKVESAPGSGTRFTVTLPAAMG